MGPRAQLYRPRHPICTAVSAEHTARLCSTHHSRSIAVRTVLPGVCAGSGLIFPNNEFRVYIVIQAGNLQIRSAGDASAKLQIRGLNAQPEAVCYKGLQG